VLVDGVVVAGVLVDGVDVPGVVVVGAVATAVDDTSQILSAPGTGSPKTSLVHAIVLVAVRVA
jgi:hypothetical protein